MSGCGGVGWLGSVVVARVVLGGCWSVEASVCAVGGGVRCYGGGGVRSWFVVVFSCRSHLMNC